MAKTPKIAFITDITGQDGAIILVKIGDYHGEDPNKDNYGHAIKV